MSHYPAYKNADLRLMLKQRGLPISGAKAKLVSRLTDYDIEHPFRFLNLPGEIRNEIYKYIIAADAELLKLVKTKSRVPDHTAETCEKANRASTSQPALFRTCSQIRAESRGLFYHYHAFTLHIWVEEDKEVHKGLLSHIFWWFEHARREKSSLERVMRWLDAIGAEARR